MRIIIFAFFVGLSLAEELYNEKHRPQLHYSPPTGWMNDPNGIVFHDGLFQLFYQHTPNSTVNGPISWGHAISPDLIHWKTLPVAISPTQGNYIFSGSAIIDYNNVTGLQPAGNSKKTLIAIFTAHNANTSDESQWIAYSNDGPEYKTLNMYPKNPIIKNPTPHISKDFRDPQVLKYGDKYVIFLSAHNKSLIYNSPDLLQWTLVGEFGEHEGSHKDVWECPSLFPINATIKGATVRKWVLIISLGPDQQYFVGSFDGKSFKNDNSKETILWVDYGPDSYAGITYDLLPDGRRIFINWMNRWEYASSLNFNVWNGQTGIPRELKLIDIGNGTLRLASTPLREFEKLRVNHMYIESRKIDSDLKIEVPKIDSEKRLLDVELALDLTQYQQNDTVGIEFSGGNNSLLVLFTGKEFVLDRSNSGKTKFNKPYGLVWKAPRLVDTPHLPIRIIIDRSTIEIYADDGLSVLSGVYYSDEDLASTISVFHRSNDKGSIVNLSEFKVYQLKSIWRDGPPKPLNDDEPESEPSEALP